MGKDSRVRHYVITCWDTTVYKLWKKLDLTETTIRYLSYQFERTPDTNKRHVQGYVEFFKPISLAQAKKRLRCNTVNLQPRKGTRVQARDYSLKDGSPACREKYPQWVTHGYREQGTEPVELGDFETAQGNRSDLSKVADLIKSGATEHEIFMECPQSYLKYSGHIRRGINLMMHDRLNEYVDLTVKVFYGDSRTGKNRSIYKTYGARNCFSPVWNGTKYWFDGYTGQKVLVFDEFIGQATLPMMQKLMDHYRQQVEVKGGFVVSNWDTIILTSNLHPEEWWKYYDIYTDEQEQSIINRIDEVKYFEIAKATKRKTWTSISKGKQKRGASITSPLLFLSRENKIFTKEKDGTHI